MFINDDEGKEQHTPEFTVVNLPSFKADPAADGTRSPTFLSDYVRNVLKWESDLHYPTRGNVLPWKWDDVGENRDPVQVADVHERLELVDLARQLGLGQRGASLGND